MTGTSEDNLRDFWERTAQRFAKRGFRAVCWPTSIGLVNWYIDILQRTVLKSVFHQCQGDKLQFKRLKNEEKTAYEKKRIRAKLKKLPKL